MSETTGLRLIDTITTDELITELERRSVFCMVCAGVVSEGNNMSLKTISKGPARILMALLSSIMDTITNAKPQDPPCTV